MLILHYKEEVLLQADLPAVSVCPQIMNYGLGGAILTHRDSMGSEGGQGDPSSSESLYNGGPRLATVMLWLAPALQGGRTVFAGAGLQVQVGADMDGGGRKGWDGGGQEQGGDGQE